jgi:hypothetical protein
LKFAYHLLLEPVWKKLLERDECLLQRIIDVDSGNVNPANGDVSLFREILHFAITSVQSLGYCLETWPKSSVYLSVVEVYADVDWSRYSTCDMIHLHKFSGTKNLGE